MKIMKKMIAMLIATCMVMSLFGVNAFAEEAPDVQAPAYRCQREEHTHTDACYTTLICGKVAHGEECYTEGVKTCENHEVTRTLICELHVHEDACYHVHSAVGGECRPLNCQDSGEPTCGKTEETVECELTEEHTEHNETCVRHQHVDGCYHQHSEACYPLTCGKTEETLVCEIVSDHVHDDTCYEEHVHSRECYVTEPDCGKAEHAHDDSCIPPSYNYYINPINENINLTLYNYGSYINVGEDKSLQFGWHNDLAAGGRPYEGIDGPAMMTDGTVFTSWADIYYSNKIWNFPTVDRTLNEDGYPQISGTQKYTKYNVGGNEIVGVSLEYLFPKTGDALKVGAATNPLTDYDNLRDAATFIENSGFNSNYESMRFDMVGDGGLFYKDSNGYYIYDSAKRW